MDGVVGTSVGYTGSPNTGGGAASYSTVCAGDGNTEAVRVEFNPEKLSYDDVLGIFWANHNPCSPSKPQYMSAIFAATPEHEAAARKSLADEQARRGQPISTKVLPFDEATWHEAEEYHQNYFQKQRGFE